MTVQATKCRKRGNLFQLGPNKPGFADMCPACSPRKTLSPVEAKEAHLYKNSDEAERLFRNAIKEKREAEARGDSASANKYEDQIQELYKVRIKVPRKRVP
jgi:hypothetical protein